ncbi:MAG TPA: PhzF family phenazine biosynthesis protein [Clostridia bacterium]|nr:PhzF family phenazine biosynthesis protein [Clostridia bacterium]
MKEHRTFPYVQYDVFTSRRLEGNQLAVFTDARGLSDAEMQALARETNLSETTFVIPRDSQTELDRGVRVRIFTTGEELPFAGHPTLGTAMFLRERDGKDRIELDLNVGKIPVTFSSDPSGSVTGEMRQRDPEFGSVHSREEVARAVGVNVEEIAADLPIQTTSTGMAFAIVPFRSLSTLAQLRTNWERCSDYLARTDAKFFYFVSRETVSPEAQLHARMIFYNGEDPATGSAAGCCAAWAVRHGVVASDQRALIEQGLEIKRASRIYFRATRAGDGVVNVRVSGNAVKVMAGEVLLEP